MQSVNFTCNILQAKKKVGELKVDEHGYREICVGAFDAYNDVGEYYAFTDKVRNMFAHNSQFNRRIAKSYLRGEVTHPERRPGESVEAFMRRALTIDLKNVSHHIKGIRLEPGKDEKGRPIIMTIALVAPSGVHHDMMQRMFDNPDENVAFSIRCLTSPVRLPNGGIGKGLEVPITWDLVGEPGIENANKYSTPSMESAKSDIIITPEMVDRIEKVDASFMGFESVKETCTRVRTELGWQKIQVIPTSSATHW